MSAHPNYPSGNSTTKTILLASLLLSLGFFAMSAQAAPKDHRRPAAHSKKAPHSAANHFHRVGHKVRTLPHQHLRISLGSSAYFYAAGVFYRAYGTEYIVVRAPIGARIKHLPGHYVSFSIGGKRYFHVNATYYLFEQDTDEYIVVAKPDAAPDLVGEPASANQLFIYPSNGQTEEQLRHDRYECYVWSNEQSGYDPSLSTQVTENREAYYRAFSACMTARGYTVN